MSTGLKLTMNLKHQIHCLFLCLFAVSVHYTPNKGRYRILRRTVIREDLIFISYFVGWKIMRMSNTCPRRVEMGTILQSETGVFSEMNLTSSS
jgi:hypothetical protein